MAAYVKTLKSGNDIIYPQTKTSGVFDENNVNLQTVLDNMSGSIQSFVGKRITSDYNVTVTLSVFLDILLYHIFHILYLYLQL